MKKILAALLAALIALLTLTLTGCGKTAESAENASEANLLTCIFRGKSLPLPAGYRADPSVKPYADPKSGAITLLARTDDGFALVRLSENGKAESTPLNLPEDLLLSGGTVTEEELTFYGVSLNRQAQNPDPKSLVGRYSIASGEMLCSPPLSELPGRSVDPTENSVTDFLPVRQPAGDNRYCAVLSRELLLFDEAMQPVQTMPIPAGSYIESVSAAPDGTVWVNMNDGDSILYSLSPGQSAFGAGIRLSFRAGCLFFADGHDLYCSSTDGLYALDFPADTTEKPDVTLILDYDNSALDWQYTRILSVLDPETVLLSVTDSVTYEADVGLYRHAEDVDVSTITTVEVVYGSDMLLYQTNLTSAAASFNRQHPDVRVILTDLSDGTYDGGEEAILRGIGLGELSPDLVLTMSTSSLAMAMRDQKLYTDLSSYLNSDPALSDDLFGCVKRYCSAADGSMWGLTPTFLPNTLVGRTDLLGESAADGWDLSELLDFAEKQPENVRLSDVTFDRLLGPNGWNAFIDREAGTCSFDSAEFKRALTLRDRCTKEFETVLSTDTDYPLYQNGSVLLHTCSFLYPASLLRVRMLFGTDELTFTGYPSAEGSGMEMSRTLCYIIPANAEHPAEAWELLKALLAAGVDENMMDGFSALKSNFDKVAQWESQRVYRLYYDGSSTSGSRSNQGNPAPLEKPGVIDYLDPEDAEELKTLFDCAGTPAALSLPDEIAAIIAEELSAYDAGAASADECAKVIQSRVSLWLAEHR